MYLKRFCIEAETKPNSRASFIGEHPDPDDIPLPPFRPFPIGLDGFGNFGDLWWAGIAESAPLASVVRRVRRALADSGIPFDRKRFSAHITLIRRAAGKMPGLQIRPAEMRVESISLMRSDRGRNGMIYTELGAIEAQS